jgi:hypothetical protein
VTGKVVEHHCEQLRLVTDDSGETCLRSPRGYCDAAVELSMKDNNPVGG